MHSAALLPSESEARSLQGQLCANAFMSVSCALLFAMQYHDLGLIYATITPFLMGWRQHCMSPITFLQRPVLWLELMSKHKCNW